ncbi:unnamed protein product, partial [Rotaria sordida]
IISNQNNTEEQECCNCEIISQSIHSTPKGILCNECYIYWQKSNLMQPELYQNKSLIKKVKRPPKNMSIDLINLTSSNSIEKLEEDIHYELSTIQLHNQSIEYLTNQSRIELETMHIPFLTKSINSNETTTSTWSIEEILLAIQA